MVQEYIELLPQKLRAARKALKMNQTVLAKAIGVTQRSMTDYECGRAVPRKKHVEKMACELGVTLDYLIDDTIPVFPICRMPDLHEMQMDTRIDEVLSHYDEKKAKAYDKLLQDSMAFFAGGNISQADKDCFFEALMTSYVRCKLDAQQQAAQQKEQDTNSEAETGEAN